MEKILVTGAGGFIGRRFCGLLADKKIIFTGLYRCDPGLNGPVKHLVQADLTEDKSEKILHKIRPGVIIHCAAVIPSSFGSRDAYGAAEQNRIIDGRIIAYCRDNDCRILYVSTTGVYGLIDRICGEDTHPAPVGPYAVSKLKTEEDILKHIPRHVIFRINAPYGPGQKAQTVLRIFIERAICGQDLFYHGRGSRSQKFTAVEDVSRAFICALEDDKVSGVFNIAGKKEINMKELAMLIIKISGNRKSRALPSHQSDPQEAFRALFDISRARKILRWSPAVELKDGIGGWIRHMKEAKGA